MTDRQLECIAAIAKYKSLTGAAKQLYVSQSSLSQMLTKMEKEVGAQLFRRTNTSMILTYAGEQYLKAAEEIFEIKQNLSYRLKDLEHADQGRITIGISPKRSSLFMPAVLSAYMKRFPQVEIVFVEEDQRLLEDMVRRNEVDVAFVTHPLLKEELKYRFLYREYVLLVLPLEHPLNGRLDPEEVVDLNVLKDTPFVLTREGHDIRRLCNQAFADFQFTPNIRLETQSLDVCFQMAAYGIGATMLPDTLAKGHPFRGRVRCYRIGDAYGRYVAITHRKNMYVSHILKEFMDIAAEQIIQNYSTDRLPQME